MKKRPTALIFMVPFFSLLVLLFQNCSTHDDSNRSSKGTDTGNVAARYIAADQIVNAICARSAQCFSVVNENECKERLYAEPGLPAEINVAGFSTMAQLRQAEFEQKLPIDLDRSITCTSELYATTCDQVNAAIESQDSRGLISASCKQVY